MSFLTLKNTGFITGLRKDEVAAAQRYVQIIIVVSRQRQYHH